MLIAIANKTTKTAEITTLTAVPIIVIKLNTTKSKMDKKIARIKLCLEKTSRILAASDLQGLSAASHEYFNAFPTSIYPFSKK